MPLLNNVKKTCIINAGHWDKDPGVIIDGIVEKDEVKKIRDLTTEYLKEAGFEVIEVPDNLDLYKTIDFVNTFAPELNDGLAIGIHLNRSRFEGGPLRGTEVYSGTSWRSIAISKVLSESIANELGVPDRGYKSHTQSGPGSLGFIAKVICWSAVLECLYLDNNFDRYALSNDGYKKIAKGITTGIMKLYGVEETHPKPPITKEELKITLQQKIISLLLKVVDILRKILFLKQR